LYERKIKKTPQQLQSKSGLKAPEFNAAAETSPSSKGEATASFIEIISKRIDKLLAKTPPKSSAA
jgi:hypothetical protein